MPYLSSTPLLAVFATVCAVLVIKAQILGAITAANRGRLKQFINEEDATWLGGQHVEADGEQGQRLLRAHRNDLENLLPFFIGGMLYLQSGANSAVGMGYFGLFLAARMLHTFAYMHRKPMLRRNTYTLGWLVTIVMSAHAAGALLLS